MVLDSVSFFVDLRFKKKFKKNIFGMNSYHWESKGLTGDARAVTAAVQAIVAALKA